MTSKSIAPSLLLPRLARLARESPDARALIDRTGALDWAALWTWSARLAAELAARGVGPGMPVALALPRGHALVAAIIAVWRLRAYYVPLDPALPDARLRWQAHDCGAVAAIAEQSHDWLPAGMTMLDPMAYRAAADDIDDGALVYSVAETAYIIYTSGSSGRPKGVVVSHGALAAYLGGLAECLPTSIGSAAYLSTPAADLGHTALFGALWHGWTLHLIEADVAADPDAFADYMQTYQVDLLKIVPSHLDALMQGRAPASALPRRCLLIGGESAPTRLAERIAALRPELLLINHYGPTETTVGVLTHAGAQSKGTTLPLGKPLRHAYVRVLDADGDPVPKGVAGELCIGGQSVADGYLRRAALTAERFVPDPSGHGSRLYRSGDKGRLLPDGEFAFLGRLDEQVKIRGYRVEPEEVAARLRGIDGVADAIVVARAAGDDAPLRLLAYVSAGEPLDGLALRATLVAELPDYMVPAAITVLASLPLTANGKIDRAALPEPSDPSAAHAAGKAPIGPGDPAESALLAIWREVLGRQDIGVQDNFFAVGGDSILSLKIIARARRAGLRITPKQMFEQPTVAGCARLAATAPAPATAATATGADEQHRWAQAGVSRDAVEAVYPATPLQQGLLFHGLCDTAAGFYIGQLRLTIAADRHGALDIERLRAAWQTVIDRHPVLRTRFFWPAGGEPLQIVEHRVVLPFAVHDFSQENIESYSACFVAARDALAATAFDTAQAPLTRVDLFVRPDGAHDMLWGYHHALTDGWSTALVLAELAAAYRSPSADDRPAAMACYADYVDWLRSRPSAAEFWRRRLAGLDDPAGLASALGPYLRPPLAVASRAGYGVLARDFDAERHARWLAAARQLQVTLNTLVQGAWALLLARLAGRSQALFGVTVSGRQSELPGIEQIVGLFINSLPVCTEVPADASSAAWLRALQAHNAELREVEHTSLADLQAWVGRTGEALFDSLLVFENQPLDDAIRIGREVFDVRAVETTHRTHYALTLVVAPHEALAGRAAGSMQWRWDMARLDEATVQRLAAQFEQTLDALAACAHAPHMRLRELIRADLPADRAVAFYPFVAVTERIQARALSHPHATALLFEDARGRLDRISYRQLHRWSVQLAQQWTMLERGEPRIGLALNRSPALVAAMLGAWRAGAAYVPLDPAYPDERLRETALDAGLDALICDSDDRDRFARLLPDMRLLEVALADCRPDAPQIDDAPAVPPHPDQLAYVIYTSGSTGRPKGVGVTHANLARLFDAGGAPFEFRPDDVWALLHSPAFDFSVWEIFGALVNGAQLLVVPRETARDPALLHRLLERAAVSVLNQTPSAFAALSEIDAEAPLRALRYVIFGGEKLEPARLAHWWTARQSHQLPTPNMVNMYGITETTVHVTHRVLTPADLLGDGGAPSAIGGALADLSLQVRDAWGEWLPSGGVGELHVGGAGLARGYLGRPGLTAERFVPDPDGAPGARLYRSGDLARRLADGDLDYIGRNDSQLKLRGFRIEAGEIEAALRTHAEIRHAVVAVREQSLIAWIVPVAAAAPMATALRDHLAARLPAHMLPTAFVTIERLPVTPNGKLDRAALPSPQATASIASVAPRDATETMLASIWQQVLGVDEVGVFDDFFLLGGHSLLAVRVAAALRESFGQALPLRTIFERPVLADLAATLRESTWLPSASAEPTIGAIGDLHLPLLPGQQRLWFLWRLAPQASAYHVSGALRLDGALDQAALQAAVSALVARHPALRLRFGEVGGVPYQRIAVNGDCAMRVLDLHGDAGALDGALEAFVREPFDLLAEAPLRCALVRLSTDWHVLLLVMHHLIADDGSVGLLCEDFAALYGAFARGEQAPAAGLGDAAYAALLRRKAARLENGRETAQLDYWLTTLGDAGAPLALPIDRPRRGPRQPAGGRYRWSLSATVTQRLRRQAGERHVTLFMTVLAAFQLLLYRYSGQHDVRIGVPLAGRDDADAAMAVGFFVNTVVIRGQLAGAQRADDVLEHVRESLLAAHANQDLPLSRIVDALQVPRELDQTPLFHVLVNQQQAHVLRRELAPGLWVSPHEVGNGEAQFDLMLNMVDGQSAADGLDFTFTYARDIFDEATIARLADHFVDLLRQWSLAPSQPLTSFVLSAAQPAAGREVRGNDLAMPDVVAPDVVARFAAQVDRRPDAIAINDGKDQLSYRQLDDWSGAIAATLHRREIGVESRVGVAMQRSVGLIAALLGVLRAGAAYVPLDPTYPTDRLRHVLDDAGIGPVLLDVDSAQRHAALFQTHITIDVESLRHAERGWAGDRTAHPQQLAYVIYTSGSTGTPKGVGITRHNLARLFDAAPMAFDQHDVWTWFHSYAFDFSVWEIFGALVHGARLVIVPAWTTREPASFQRLLCEERVTVLNQTPSAFAPLLAADLEAEQSGQPCLRALRYVIFGGERLEPTLLADWASRLARRGTPATLVNMYGITETTVHVTHRQLDDAALSASSSVIGAPLDDLTLHVLDGDLNSLPPGANGEMWVGGAGLARGYLGRPGLTAERFVPNPYGPSGVRLYRSGDLARRRVDGELEYLGRNDQQVKIRGFRIEPGEIQAALLVLPQVREAAVLARDTALGGKQLIAYLVAPNAPDDADYWQEQLAERLPIHMLPSAFVLLPRLPLTGNGKLDHAALPTPEHAGAHAAHRVEPANALERILLGIWQGVLRRADIGITDNFFAVGGDSILSLQIVAKAQAAGWRLTPRQLFEAPTVAQLARVATALAPLSTDTATEAADASWRSWGLAPDQVEDVYPATPLQVGMLYHVLAQPERRAYLNQLRIGLRGPLDIDALKGAWRAAMERHAVLRTGFDWQHGESPSQIVRHRFALPFAAHDWRAIDDYEVALADWRERDLDAGIAPDTAPLWRVALFTRAEQRFDLLWTHHHLLLDGWSAARLLGEIMADYRARTAGEIWPSEPAPAYRDYVQWLRQNTDDDSLEQWWRARHGDVASRAQLLSSLPRASGDAPGSHAYRQTLPLALGERLRQIAREHKITLNTLMQGAWAMLLARYGHQQGVAYGTVFSGRPPQLPRVERMLGLFVNSLPVWVEVDGQAELGAWLRGLQDNLSEIGQYQHTPLARIQQWTDSRGEALFDSLLAFENYPVDEALSDLCGPLQVGAINSIDPTHYPLALTIIPRELIALEWAWDGARIDRPMVGQLERHYTELLQQLCEAPHARVGELRLSGGAAAAVARAPMFGSLPQRLSAQARRTPTAQALCCESATLSYAELDTWSDRLAARLIDAGVRAESRVGLCVTRGPALIAGLLGILKSGGAFVPLDPDYPSARLTQMLVDADIAQVVADAASLKALAGLPAGCAVLDVTDMANANVPPAPMVHPHQLAYVLYTSGSTGVPKGVAVEHGSLWAHLEDFQQTYRIEAGDTVLHSSTINFDVALHEILPALLVGARVEMRGVAPWELHSLSERLVQRQVTFARIPTALWQSWQREAPPRESLRLRQVTVGGEALPGDALARWKAGPLGDIRLDNLYGPTETTVASLYRETVEADGAQVTVPIGVPYPSRSARVIDTYGDEAPTGGLGELCLGGVTVARGYLGRAGLTAERFVPDPWGEPGSRLYRSGDLCRQREDGTVAYLGRLDQQVKLRGQRIELGEIETVLRQCAGVQEALVQVHGSGERQRLAGYIVGHVDLDEVRDTLASRLPSYMLPASLSVLAALPRMANGKLDRAALPEPEEGERQRVAPGTAAQIALLAIWSQVLGRDDLGITDNFFEVGGDSILSLQIVARAREAGWRLSPRQLFEQPSIAQLAARIERLDPAAAVEDREHMDEPLGLTPIQHWFFERYPHGESHWNQSVLLKVAGTLDVAALRRAAQRLHERHDALRLRFKRDDAGRWQARVGPAEDLGQDWLQIRALASPAALNEAGEGLQSSLDLGTGPLWRMGCYQLPDGWRVLWVIHHLAVDGVSWRVLLDELQLAYAQAEQGEAITLPPPSTSWRTWSRKLLAYAGQAEHVAELAWWQTALDGPSEPPLFSPSLFPRRAGDHADAPRTLSWSLSPTKTAMLLREAPRAYRLRVDEVLLAALSRVLGQHTGRADILFELEGHGREDVLEGVDLSRTVGWFTSQFPLRLPSIAAPADAMLEVRRRLRAVPSHGLHWGLLAHSDDGVSRAALATLPVAEVGFNYLGRFDRTLAQAGRFGFADETAGQTQAAGAARANHALDINGLIAGERLSLSWSYCPSRIDDALAQRLVEAFDVVLGEILEHLLVAESAALPEDESALLPAVPMEMASSDGLDDTAISWVERARAEARLSPPNARMLGDWLRRRDPAAAPITWPHGEAAFAVLPLNALGAPRSLFCLPPGHGMVGEYRSLAAALNGAVTVYALQSPLLRGQHALPASFEELAEEYAARILAVQPWSPHALLGWSFGGRLAAAVADRLARRQRPVAFIGIVDTATHWESIAGESTAAGDVQSQAATSALLPAALAGTLLGAALRVDELHAALMARHTLPSIAAELHVWQALHNRDDRRRRMDWRRVAAGSLHEYPLEATHASIIHHPALPKTLMSLVSRQGML